MIIENRLIIDPFPLTCIILNVNILVILFDFLLSCGDLSVCRLPSLFVLPHIISNRIPVYFEEKWEVIYCNYIYQSVCSSNTFFWMKFDLSNSIILFLCWIAFEISLFGSANSGKDSSSSANSTRWPFNNTSFPQKKHGPTPSCSHTTRPQVKQLFTRPWVYAWH